MPCVTDSLPRGFRTIAELESSNSALYSSFNSLVWHHVRRFQRWQRIPESDLEDIVPALWAKLLRTSKRYRNPAGMNLVIVNRLKRVLEEHRKGHQESSGNLEDSDFGCSHQQSYMDSIRAEMTRLRSSEVVVVSLVLLHQSGDRKQGVSHASKVLDRDYWWIERKIESAKSKLPALGILTPL